MPIGGVCAEIGVWKGDFSQLILDTRRPREFHLVDPWNFSPHFPKRWYGGGIAHSQADMDDIWKAVVQRFAAFPSVQVHKRKSTEIAKEFTDRYFDWIYIDGDHSCQAVLDDLVCWYPKVKPGGYILLDYYNWKDESGQYSVRKAIHEFISYNNVGDVRMIEDQFMIQIPRIEAMWVIHLRGEV